MKPPKDRRPPPKRRTPAARPKRARDFAAEYDRRIARGVALGRSRSQARGHPASGDIYIKRRPKASDAKLEQALRSLRETQNLTRSAKGAAVSPERFRRFLREKKLAKRKGRRWLFTDRRLRTVAAITTNGETKITVAGFNKASLVMQHHAAVRAFLNSPDPVHPAQASQIFRRPICNRHIGSRSCSGDPPQCLVSPFRLWR